MEGFKAFIKRERKDIPISADMVLKTVNCIPYTSKKQSPTQDRIFQLLVLATLSPATKIACIALFLSLPASHSLPLFTPDEKLLYIFVAS